MPALSKQSSIKINTAFNGNAFRNESHMTSLMNVDGLLYSHDDIIKWKHFPRYWPFVRGIHRSPVHSTHKGQWRRALMFSLICVWINGWANNREAGDLRRYRAHYYVIVMLRGSENVRATKMQNCDDFTVVGQQYMRMKTNGSDDARNWWRKKWLT